MKILNLIKIILLSTILLPCLIASAGFLDDLKRTGGVQKLKKECEKNNAAEACFKAGVMFLENPNTEYAASMEKEAIKMFTKGCELGNLESCGQMAKRGDLKAANKGCELGNLESCAILADKGDLKAAIKAGDLSKDKDGKIKYYGKACEKEDVKGCEALCLNGLFDDYLDGCIELAQIEDKKTPDEAAEHGAEEIKWYLKACDNGNMEGCFFASEYTKDSLEQKKLLDKSCLPKFLYACFSLSRWHYNNSDLKQAEYFMNLACKEYYEDSCEVLKNIRNEIADISNKEAAAKMAPILAKLKDACDKGDLNECIQHGLKMGGPADQKIPWFKKACDGGVSEGCFQMGQSLYELNKPDEGLGNYIKACNGGYAQGCYYAGWYHNKSNRPADAKKYYFLACNLAHGLACNNLGAMESNKGNQAEAAKFYTKACSAGNTTGCNNLAKLQIDYNSIAEARKYLNEACDSGSNAACQKLVALTKEFK